MPTVFGVISVPPMRLLGVTELRVKLICVGIFWKQTGRPTVENATPDNPPVRTPVSIASGVPLLFTSLKLPALGMKRAVDVVPLGVCSCNVRTAASNKTGDTGIGVVAEPVVPPVVE